MGKATGWGDFQKNWHLEHPNAEAYSNSGIVLQQHDSGGLMRLLWACDL